MSDLVEQLKILLQPIQQRLGGMISRVVVRNVNDDPGRQELQVEGFDEELHPIVEHFQPFGVRGYPPTDCDGIGFAVGGYRNHLVVFGVAPKVSGLPALSPGDTMHHCLDPKVWAHAQFAGAYVTQGRTAWQAFLDGNHSYITMTPSSTVIHVEDPGDPSKFSRITITPVQVKIETLSFVHP